MNAFSLPTVPTLAAVRPALAAFGQAHPQIAAITVFGSIAREEATAASDVDVVMRFVPGSLPESWAAFSFLDDLETELAAHLGRPVHLVTTGELESAVVMKNHSLPRAVARDGRLVYELEPTPN